MSHTLQILEINLSFEDFDIILLYLIKINLVSDISMVRVRTFKKKFVCAILIMVYFSANVLTSSISRKSKIALHLTMTAKLQILPVFEKDSYSQFTVCLPVFIGEGQVHDEQPTHKKAYFFCGFKLYKSLQHDRIKSQDLQM